jgi:hypothetical protein
LQRTNKPGEVAGVILWHLPPITEELQLTPRILSESRVNDGKRTKNSLPEGNP